MLMRATDRWAALRAREFGRLDRAGVAYLDYTGAALYPASLVRRDARRLAAAVRGNPHADSGPSLASTEAVERARALTLSLSGPTLCTTTWCSPPMPAVRSGILAEAFPFERTSRLVLTADNHNSVNGLAWPARRARARVRLVPLTTDLRAEDPAPALERCGGPSLFAFPAQSNFSGVRHPLDWVAAAQARGYRVLLDAASYVPSARLDLSAVPADFVALSFYKIFGYPTGVGALVARRDALADLRRRYFGGGTVDYVSMPHRLAQRKPGAAGFEDGTTSFLAMDAVADGLQWMERIGMDAVACHTAAMTARLLEALHAWGDDVVVYGPPTLAGRGGTVAFNVSLAAGCVRTKKSRRPRAARVSLFEAAASATRARRRTRLDSTRRDPRLPARRVQSGPFPRLHGRAGRRGSARLGRDGHLRTRYRSAGRVD